MHIKPKKRKNHAPLVIAFATVLAAGTAQAEPASIKGTIVDVFGSRVVVQDGANARFLVNLGPALSEIGAVKAGDTVTVAGDMRPSGEVRADSIMLADGRTIVSAKDKRSWTNWLMSDEPETAKATFDSTEAARILTEAGYTATGDLTAEKSHFVAMATKDGQAYDVDVHKDGTIDAETAFTAEIAQKALADDGYTAVEGLNRDRKHFVSKAMKDGKRYNVEVDRDGDIDEWVDLSAAEIKAKVTDAGYAAEGEPVAKKRHFEVLAMKDGRYFELHIDRDGDVEETRTVEKSDPKWASSFKS